MIDHFQDQLHLQGVDPLQGRKLFVRKRDGRMEEFNEARIYLAIESAFKTVAGIGQDARVVGPMYGSIRTCAGSVVEHVLGRAVRGERMEVEKIQDAVEAQLIAENHVEVARCYILYREKRRQARADREAHLPPPASVAQPPVDDLQPAPKPVVPVAPAAPIAPIRPLVSIPPSAPMPAPVPVVSAVPVAKPRVRVTKILKPDLLLARIYAQAIPGLERDPGEEWKAEYRRHFHHCINEARYLNLLALELTEFDLEILAAALRPERDELFPASGLQELYEYYLLQDGERRLETPQYFWMRLAMGLAANEGDLRDARALEFYEVLSTFRFVPSETILAHAGTATPHLASCWSATDWNDLEHVTTQVGPRLAARRKKGLTCSWLEPWHASIWSFLERARPGEPAWTHDLNKALWLPDLFMKRVAAKAEWTLFEPSETPELHQSFGRAFEEKYLAYEQMADRGELRNVARINAVDLWLEILSSIAQTGQPWIGFKDTANVRSAQANEGVVHSGALGAAVLLNTSANEISSCAMGSVNLAAHLSTDGERPLDEPQLRATVRAAVRMLDNALTVSAYPSDEARFNMRERRPIALGVFGFQDALDRLHVNYASAAAAEFADASTELLSHAALLSSSELARERGSYAGYAGSKWEAGLLPIDTLAALNVERGTAVDIDAAFTQDWSTVRDAIRRDGLRHSATTAICATDAASKITGVSRSIEPARFDRAGKDRSLFEIAPQWLIECAARRQKWLDLGEALTLYAADGDLSLLAEIYMQAWEKGLKGMDQLVLPKEFGEEFPRTKPAHASGSVVPTRPVLAEPESTPVS